MKFHYTIDDSATRLPLSIRSADAVQDRSSDLRSAPGVHLVELTTQHMMGTGATLMDELVYYFDHDQPTENDPYGLAHCYAHHTQLEDLWRDMRDAGSQLVALDEIEALFPDTFQRALPLTLAVTVVGCPAFGYVRTYKDTDGDEYYGLVVNLAQAQPHLESTLGQFSRSLLIDTIARGFFNHHAFLLAYAEYNEAIGRLPQKPLARLKDMLMCDGIAWYLSYSHNFVFYDTVLNISTSVRDQYVADWNYLVEEALSKRLFAGPFDEGLAANHALRAYEQSIGGIGYHAARAIANQHGIPGLRESIARGPDHFIRLYNALGEYELSG